MRRQRVRTLDDNELLALAVDLLVRQLLEPYAVAPDPKQVDRVMKELVRRGLARKPSTSWWD